MHLQFAMELGRFQLQTGRHVVFEHPLTAKSWSEECVQNLVKVPRVLTTKCHQCMYGLVARTRSGDDLPAREPTQFATSSKQMAARLQRLCDHSHAHPPLESDRAALAAFYPEGLILELQRRISDTNEAEAMVKDATDIPHHQETHADQEEECDKIAAMIAPQKSNKTSPNLLAAILAKDAWPP